MTYSAWKSSPEVKETGPLLDLSETTQDADAHKGRKGLSDSTIVDIGVTSMNYQEAGSTRDRKWCPLAQTSKTVTSTFSDQSWVRSSPFSYAFDVGDISSCTDDRISYNLVSIEKKDFGIYTDASSFLDFTESTRTIASKGPTPAVTDEFLVTIEAVVNDGSCHPASFTITNPCANNILSNTGTGFGDQTYTFGETAITASPASYISSTVLEATCPRTYKYYLWNESNDSWVLQSSNSAPFSDFDASSGLLTI